MTSLGWLIAIIVGVAVALVVRAIILRCRFSGDTLWLGVTGAVGGVLGAALVPASVGRVVLGGANILGAILIAAALVLVLGAICCCRGRRDDG
ncbi:MAG TPA: hypothetical protein VIK92_04765 [Thermaerobacter sp.]